MTREEAAKLLPILQAFAEGRQIEGIYKGLKSPWMSIENLELNEGMEFRVKPRGDGKKYNALCYTFMGKLRPLYFNGETELQRFDDFVPGEWVLKQKQLPMPENKYVQDTMLELWHDLSIYNKEDLV